MSFLSFFFFLISFPFKHRPESFVVYKRVKGCLDELELTKLGNSDRAVSGAAFNHKRDIESDAIDTAEADTGGR